NAAEWRPPVARRCLSGSDRARRELQHTFESAPEHAHSIEWHAFGVHHALHARIFHHLGIDAVTVLARVIDYPCKHDDLAVLQLHALRKRRDLTRLHVVANAFPILKRAMFDPDLACLLCHATIRVEIAKRYRYDESIDVVCHCGLLCVMGFSLEFASAG